MDNEQQLALIAVGVATSGGWVAVMTLGVLALSLAVFDPNFFERIMTDANDVELYPAPDSTLNAEHRVDECSVFSESSETQPARHRHHGHQGEVSLQNSDGEVPANRTLDRKKYTKNSGFHRHHHYHSKRRHFRPPINTGNATRSFSSGQVNNCDISFATPSRLNLPPLHTRLSAISTASSCVSDWQSFCNDTSNLIVLRARTPSATSLVLTPPKKPSYRCLPLFAATAPHFVKSTSNGAVLDLVANRRGL